MIYFESTAATILPHDLVSKKQKSGIKTLTQIYATEAATVNETKPGFVKTGVEMRWYTKKEYKIYIQGTIKRIK